MMNKLKFATGNEHKLKEAQAILRIEIEQVKIDLDEIQSIDLEAVIKHKAIEGYKKVGEPVLVEDTGLFFDAWNGLPGALIKWFLESIGNEGILNMLKPYQNRNATAVAMIGLWNGKTLTTSKGEIKGIISNQPQGDSSFGWDPIFIPNDYKKSFAQMTFDEKNSISHRKLAFVHFRDQLKNFSL